MLTRYQSPRKTRKVMRGGTQTDVQLSFRVCRRPRLRRQEDGAAPLSRLHPQAAECRRSSRRLPVRPQWPRDGQTCSAWRPPLRATLVPNATSQRQHVHRSAQALWAELRATLSAARAAEACGPLITGLSRGRSRISRSHAERVARLGWQLDAEAVALHAAGALEAVGDGPAPGLIGPHGAEGLPALGQPDLELDELSAGRGWQAANRPVKSRAGR